jgi:penicillin V acylase-like amidase (Ntn superfamily)
VLANVHRRYHDRKYTVMTNSPPFSQQLANLKHYQGFGGTLSYGRLEDHEQTIERLISLQKLGAAGIPSATSSLPVAHSKWPGARR